MMLSAGTRLGPYEILSPLGAGGMGEVYRATDERLKRDVAVKVLPAAFASDSGRLKRFEQEAQAASALNHPNILSIYDLGTHGGADGRWLAYMSDDSGRSEVYIASFPGRETTLQVSSAGGVLPTWRRDGKELFYVTPDGQLMSVDIVPGPKLSAGVPHALFKVSTPVAVGTFSLYDVAPDGQRFLFIVPVVHGTSVPLNLVINWPSLLKKEK